MNEFEAAMGLCMLDEIDNIFTKRKKVYETYEDELNGVVKFQEKNKNASLNYSYFPVIFEDENQLLQVKEALNKENIFPRRYFYPSLDTLNYIEPKQYLPVSRDISKRILCLPIYPELSEYDQSIIIEGIKNAL
jgi:dTDP-4-amino-4,6-dideoxygalactose transaminase